jgi:hypothetical protein
MPVLLLAAIVVVVVPLLLLLLLPLIPVVSADPVPLAPPPPVVGSSSPQPEAKSVVPAIKASPSLLTSAAYPAFGDQRTGDGAARNMPSSGAKNGPGFRQQSGGSALIGWVRAHSGLVVDRVVIPSPVRG